MLVTIGFQFLGSRVCAGGKCDIRLLSPVLFAEGKPLRLQMKANNNKEVSSLNKADERNLNITVIGDNIKITVNESNSHPIVVAIIKALGLIATTVLAVSHNCDVNLTEVGRFFLSLVSGS